jgi:hypothetical protein
MSSVGGQAVTVPWHYVSRTTVLLTSLRDTSNVNRCVLCLTLVELKLTVVNKTLRNSREMF